MKMRNAEKKKTSGTKGKFRHSIRTQFTLIFFLVMAGTIFICFILNQTFLKKYYIREKQEALEKTYESLNEAAGSNSISSDAFDVELQKSVSRNNIGIIVTDSESKTIKSYSMDAGIMIKRLYDNLFGANQNITSQEEQELLQDEPQEAAGGAQDGTGAQQNGSAGSGASGGAQSGSSGDSSNGDSSTGEDTDQMPPQDIPFGEKSYITSVLKQTDSYTIQTVLDRRTSSDFMEMWGTLDNGDYFLLRTALESIDHSASIANRFFGITGIAATLVGIFVSLYMGTLITKPILELTAISERMKHLDFSAKYTGKSRTEIAELGSNINELSSNLEQTISELKTANNKLKKDIREKEEIDTMRKEFLSNVTHELKTPIALIQGYAEGLQDCVNDDAESREYYSSVIVDEAGKMNSMVQKLLALNHLEFGTETVNMEHFDAIAVIRNYLQSATLLADKKDVQVRMEEQEPVMVWADSFLMEEVFTNYFSNAVNHVEESGGEKIIDIKLIPQEGNRVRISVFNTGKPIPEDSLPHIWEKFYKVDKARTRAYGGSGIGLSIVKAIMEQMHEAYGVKNYDNGVEFWFDLDTGSGSEDSSADEAKSAEEEKAPELSDKA
jgi:two-component system sensor histidine kinase VanS